MEIEYPPTRPLLVYTNALTQLHYSIHEWSSYSSSYHPKNILIDNPFDQSSRWSTSTSNQTQYLLLKLDKPAILTLVTFGKYHKPHVCNLKEFKIYIGLTPDHMVEVLQSGIKNDEEPETFTIKHKSEGVLLPCRFVKVVPTAVWGQNFNYSIWFIKLIGINSPQFLEKACNDYLIHKEFLAMRLCLKHLRQRNFLEAFDSLKKSTPFSLENEMLNEIQEQLVLKGNFEFVEKILEKAESLNLFAEYIRQCPYVTEWERINKKIQPTMRGGHQMNIDIEGQTIYLFGGWDGTNDLADFWSFNIPAGEWNCLSNDTSKDGGPIPRSCHKVCFDQINKHLYVLGGYIDADQRSSNHLNSDFFRYDTKSNTWFKISSNTTAEGGPELISDHQMVIDSENQMIYIFGGRLPNRTIGYPNQENSYSGLYSYNIKTNEWKLIRSDMNQRSDQVKIKSRIGHSMLFNQNENCLYIFSGQRLKEYLSDFYVYDIESDSVIEMTRDCSRNGGPETSFTQRATIDLDLNEIYVLSGLMREKAPAGDTTKNSFWKYDINNEKWIKVYQNESVEGYDWSSKSHTEPCPRFAHQLVYDPIHKVHYLFGGNPGDPDFPTLRLDDFWKLKLHRPQSQDIFRKATFLLRQLKFKELCSTGDSIQALDYLQKEVSQKINHSDKNESLEFSSLASIVFKHQSLSNQELFQLRNGVFEQIIEFFPKSYKQPTNNLIDLV